MAARYRRKTNDAWYPIGDDSALNWGELWILVKGWANDTRYHLAREVDPDWEFHTLGTYLDSRILLAVEGANWQRSGGKPKDRPKLVTAALLRGEVDDSQETNNGVKSGTRRGRVAEVSSATDLSSIKEQMRERRRRSVEDG